MSETVTEFKNDLLTKLVDSLCEDALKPMSIADIQIKYNLSFPFKVRRVVASDKFLDVFPVGEVTLVHQIRRRKFPDGDTLITQNCTEISRPDGLLQPIYQNAEKPHYLLAE